MGKPRVIIADTDIRYILPLQAWFAEAFFEKIDLEIISDASVFKQLFTVPQRAEILIISEDLYDVSLLRHNIEKFFLMMETYAEDPGDDRRINRIYKYTSIKEIYNVIIGKSGNILNENIGRKTDPQIVVVYSAAGGVGKTTVALGMAMCLTQNYKRVLYINASWLHSFQRLISDQTAVSSPDVYATLANASLSVYSEIKHVLRKEVFTYLPPFKASLLSLGLKYSIYEKIAVSARNSDEYDFIIVDADSEFDEDKASLIDVADKVVIVTSQSDASVFATNILAANINGIGSDKYTFVCNNFDSGKDNALISPQNSIKFSVSEYIEHLQHYDMLKAEDLSESTGIKKASFLVL